MVGFDEFVAHKSGLPIVVAVTKFIHPDNKGAILLWHNEGVYNKDSWTTLSLNSSSVPVAALWTVPSKDITVLTPYPAHNASSHQTMRTGHPISFHSIFAMPL